jgi:hypothetical protein
MTEPKRVFEGEWADGSQAVIDVGPLPTQSGLRVSIGARGGWPGLQDAEMLFTPREAVKLAHALLTIAAPESGIASQIGLKWADANRGQQTGWLFAADLLT